MLIKRLIYSALLLALALGASAQQELGTNFMQNVWQQNHFNPAHWSEYKVVVALPSVYMNFQNSAFSINDILIEDAQGNPVLDPDNIIGSLGDDNELFVQPSVDILQIGFQAGDWQFGLGLGIRSSSVLRYSREFAQVLADGNAQFIGQTVDIGPAFESQTYSETSLAVARRLLGGRLVVGGRVKYLNGLASYKTESNRIELYTDPEYYEITATTDYAISSAGIARLIMDGEDITTVEESVGLFNGNNGFAFDLGATLQVTDHLSVSASIVDIGSITWDENNSLLLSQGNFTYGGEDLDAFVNDAEVTFDAIVDTLEATFNFEEQPAASFSTALPTKIYLGARYDLSASLHFNGLLFFEDNLSGTVPAVAANITKDFGRILSLGASAAYRNGSFSNLGANLALSLGPIQFYTMTDNLLTVFSPNDAQGFNIRMGLNLVFGHRDGSNLSGPSKTSYF